MPIWQQPSNSDMGGSDFGVKFMEPAGGAVTALTVLAPGAGPAYAVIESCRETSRCVP